MEPYVGEIIMFAGNYAPRTFSYCNGQVIAISENEALFSLIGTTYGGDGRTSFGLPDLRGRIPVHNAVSSPGGIHAPIGAKQGVEKVTLTTANIPSHSHTMQGSTNAANQINPAGQVLATTAQAINAFGTSTDKIAEFDSRSVSDAGSNQAHSNMMPTLSIHFIIALMGTFPSRN